MFETPKLRAAKTDAEKATLQNAVSKTDHDIDALVYELYALTPSQSATPSRPMKSRKSNKAVKRAGSRSKTEKPPAAKSHHNSRTIRPPRTDRVAKAAQRREFRAWRAELPTALERDTLLWPEVIAESVVQEAEQYLQASLPPDYAERLAAKAHHLYPRHRQFHKALNRPGNRGRDNLYVYMRHWTCGWLKREGSALYKKLPWSFALGVPLYPKSPRTVRAVAKVRSPRKI